MEFKPHKRFVVTDRSYHNILKRDITRMAEGLGFNQTEVGKVNIIVSEMASNLIKHGAISGEFLVKPVGTAHNGLEIICLDQGPGMSDPHSMLQDGVSTAGTHGQGLGAIKRLAQEFDLFSAPGVGTIVLARVYSTSYKPAAAISAKFDVGVVLVPKLGETHCGDGGAFYAHNDSGKFLVADGLGHGEFAQQASQRAAAEFKQNLAFGPADIIKALHTPMKNTRGAVVNVTGINLKNQVLSYCGVGNIAGRLITPADPVKSLISYNGIVGHNIPGSLNNHQIPWPQNCLLVMHSDGIKSKWDISRYRELFRQDTSLVAAMIYKYFNRGSDDSLVLVCRTRG